MNQAQSNKSFLAGVIEFFFPPGQNETGQTKSVVVRETTPEKERLHRENVFLESDPQLAELYAALLQIGSENDKLKVKSSLEAITSKIQMTYRRLAKILHPDQTRSVESVLQMQKLNEWYSLCLETIGSQTELLSYSSSSSSSSSSSYSWTSPEEFQKILKELAEENEKLKAYQQQLDKSIKIAEQKNEELKAQKQKSDKVLFELRLQAQKEEEANLSRRQATTLASTGFFRQSTQERKDSPENEKKVMGCQKK